MKKQFRFRFSRPILHLVCLAVIIGSLTLTALYFVADRAASDTEPPVISTENAPKTLSVSASDADYLVGVTAHDERDGDVAFSLVVESVYGMNADGETTVTYAAFDAAGNVAKATHPVRFTDYKSPRFSLDEALVYEYGSSFDVLEAVCVSDVIDGDLSRKVKVSMLSGASSITQEGMHEVQFRITNSIGDTSVIVLPVEVCPTDAYTAELFLDTYLVYLESGDTFDAESHLRSFRARSTVLELDGKQPTDLLLRVDGVSEFSQPGVYPIRYTARYTLDGTVYVGYTKLFVVVEKAWEA